MTDVTSYDPRTGEPRAVVAQQTTREVLDDIAAAATAAFHELRCRDRAWRAGLLRTIADALEDRRSEIVAIADAETALGETRLNGELTRTCFQLRLFADVVVEGSYLEATIDHAGDTPMGPRPDLRRMLMPLGPVAVFGASNFPLAFSVPGGDTASALAAGCPVVVKAHESHPATSKLCAEVMAQAIATYGGPEGAISVVYGREPGGWLVQHPSITAVGFTGSVVAARALMDLIDKREVPIPFYGELGSVNPLVVTPEAAAERAEQIGEGLARSMTMGVGQFCTKPGLAFVPAGADGDRLLDSAARTVADTAAGVLLNPDIARSFGTGIKELAASPAIRERAAGNPVGESPHAVPARLLEVELGKLSGRMLEECFGPVTIAVRYEDTVELVDVIASLPSSLTGSIHVGADGVVSPTLLKILQDRAGRIVFNGFPTGVAVTWAQHHGGGWPATNSIHTSVGPTAIRRFLRPIAWQDAPAAVLPPELREETTGVVRRVDGVLKTPSAG
jgi:NADP-dependent aldehyde dehydrogenase